MGVCFDTALTTEPKLPKNSILGQAFPLLLSHWGLLAEELYATSSAARIATTTVTDVHSGTLNSENELLARFNALVAESFDDELTLWHFAGDATALLVKPAR